MSDARPSDPRSRHAVANPSYKPIPADPNGYSSFDDFYPFYLGEHSHPICRKLHLVGTSISSLVLLRIALSAVPKALSLIDSDPSSPTGGPSTSAFRANAELLRLSAPLWKYLAGGVAQAYFMAWVGHFWFERNRPATFKYPLYSLMGDLRMLSEVVTMKRRL